MEIITSGGRPIATAGETDRFDIKFELGTKERVYTTNVPGVDDSMKALTGKVLAPYDLSTLIRKTVRMAMDDDRRVIGYDFRQIRKIGQPQSNIMGFGSHTQQLAYLVGLQLQVAGYNFNAYKTASKEGFPGIDKAFVSHLEPEWRHFLEHGSIVGEHANAGRDLCNTPACDMTPDIIASVARAEGEQSEGKLTVQVLQGKDLDDLGMGLLKAVGQGAGAKPCLIRIDYRGAEDPAAQPIVLIGKTITFDTGGLDLKTAGGMFGMHMDMSGGASAMMALVAAVKLGLKKNVIVLMPTAENAISRHAYRPGDVIKSMSGMTVEIGNTDAEGRNVLADAVTYACQKLDPLYIVTVATLTGAAHIAMGDHVSACFTTDRAFEDALRRCGDAVCTPVHPLPFWPSMFEGYFKSDVADMLNVRPNSNRHGGAGVGAAFVHKFAVAGGLKSAAFAHIDMAPRMVSVKGEYLAPGAPGDQVPFLVHLLQQL